MDLAIDRQFIGWKEPALPTAAEFLIAHYRRGSDLDLGQVVIVVPGARAGRRLLELFVLLAEERALNLTPPTLTTEGALPEFLYLPKRPFASELVQQLAWSRALQQVSSATLKAVVPHPPVASDTVRWLELGQMLQNLHRELAADGLDFNDVAERGGQLAEFAEQDRWLALAEIQRAYLRQLDALDLWDIQTARLEAIRRQEPRTDCDIYLLGTVDLNQALRQMLDLVAARVTVLLPAPKDMADRFDAHGCLDAARWLAAALPIRDEQLLRVDGPADQAEAAANWLREVGARYSSDQIVLGLPDESLAPQLERQLTQRGVRTRWVEGRKITESPPYRLLMAAGDYVSRGRFADLAALVRHPDLEAWLLGLAAIKDGLREQCIVEFHHAADLLTALDLFQGRHLPARLDSQWWQSPESKKNWPALVALSTELDQLLEPLQCEKQPLSYWPAVIAKLLQTIYEGRTVDRNRPLDRYLIEAGERIQGGLDTLLGAPPELEPTVDLATALQLALAPLRQQALPPPPDPEAIEFLGWLELALDDAPALAVTSFNEGFVPKSLNADAFLPNRLRTQLGILNNDRRYARDAYALSVLLASKQELKLIVGRRSAEGDPRTPSRLIFATDVEQAAARALTFFSALSESAPRRNLLAQGPPRDRSAFRLPTLPPLKEPITSLSVSQFKDYLACPYRFYLKNVLHLEAVSDEGAELDPRLFGTLIHEVLGAFGQADPVKFSQEPAAIRKFLDEQLEQAAQRQFHRDGSRAAVKMQVEQARRRLAAFAEWQAARSRDGWRIVHVENPDEKLLAPFPVDGRPFSVRGRIDRIDMHAETKQICVLDYKTGDKATSPLAAHFHNSSESWLDLQLPLYRHLVGQVKLRDDANRSLPPQLGYIQLPRNLAQVGVALAEWSQEELAAADEAARNVVRGVWSGDFTLAGTPKYEDDFSAICLDRAMAPPVADETGDFE